MKYALLSKYRSELMGTAMLWVIFFHAWPIDFPITFLNKLRALGFGGVDIFILLSAMGLVNSLSRKPLSYPQFIKKRCIRILPAYYLVMLPFSIWQHCVGDISLSTIFWNCSLLYYWRQVPGAFNWYVAGILLFYLVTPLCIRWMRRASPTQRMLTVLLATVLGIAWCQLLMHWNYWCYLDVFYRVPIYFLGLWIGFAVVENRPLPRKELLCWVAIGLAGCIYLVLRKYVDFYLATCYTFILTTVPMCLLLGFVMDRLPIKPIMWLLRETGKCSLEIYLLNVTVFPEFARFSALFSINWDTYCWFAIPLNVLAGILLHYGRTALWRRLTGRPNQKGPLLQVP